MNTNKVRDSVPGKADRSPTLVYQDDHGELTTKRKTNETGSNSESHLAAFVGQRAHDRGGSPRATPPERSRAVEGFCAERGLILDPEAFQNTVIDGRPQFEGGAEHSVFFDQATNRVIKLTHPDFVGDGAVGQCDDLLEYLRGLDFTNTIFGVTDIHLEGIVALEGEFPQVVISQKFIKGREATPAEIAAIMHLHGFELVNEPAPTELQSAVTAVLDALLPGKNIAESGTVWKQGALYLSDAVPRNVMAHDNRDGSVTIVPFDVQIVGLIGPRQG